MAEKFGCLLLLVPWPEVAFERPFIHLVFECLFYRSANSFRRKMSPHFLTADEMINQACLAFGGSNQHEEEIDSLDLLPVEQD